jgi:hypothetical protein
MAGDDKDSKKPIASATTTSHTSSSFAFGSGGPSFTGSPVDPLKTIEYEVGMLRRTLEIMRNERAQLDEKVLENAIVEDAVLHARQLCLAFICEKTDPTDITLTDLIPDWEARPTLKAAVALLKKDFGTSKDSASPRYAFNKGVMHATNIRGAWGAYGPHLETVEQTIREIIGYIESEKGPFNPVK